MLRPIAAFAGSQFPPHHSCSSRRPELPVPLERMSKLTRGKVKAVDMNALVSSMTHELDYYWSLGEVHENEETSCIIYKVQEHIRRVDKLCYEPCIISIGPYHYGAPALQTMQKEKWSYLDYILKLNCEKTLLDYLQALEDITKLARNCYSEEVKMDGEEFLQMLLLDGCFVLVALGGTKGILAHREQLNVDNLKSEGTKQENGRQNISHPEDSNKDRNTENQNMGQEEGQDGKQVEMKRAEYDDEVGQWFARFFNHDLFLLENQKPFFIVKKIFKIVAGDNPLSDAEFTHEIVKYVESSLWWFPQSIQDSDKPNDIHHLLHLCHMYFRPTQRAEGSNCQALPRYFGRFLSFGRRYFNLRHYPGETEEGSPLNPEMPCLQYEQQLNRWRRAAQYLEAGVKI
uniref:Uncharacterized protein n=3 Tax=Oryza meridionalis TaxID=40149 RepID=A0A0E0DJ49_9ORYZ